MTQSFQRTAVTAAVLAVAFAGGGVLCAENAPAPATTPGSQQAITGEVVDPSSYLRHGHRGAEMEEQTYAAVDGGQSLALLEDGTETLYLFLSEQAGEDPNELAYDYINQKVTAKGQVYERGGLKGLVASSVEPVAPPAEAATTPATPDAKPSAR